MVTPPNNDLLRQLAAAGSAAERETLIFQTALDILPPPMLAAVEAAAIPHWFDARFLEALLGDEFELLYDELIFLPFISLIPGQGYVFPPETRQFLLNLLWRTDPARFLALSGRAADHCARHPQATLWESEEIYHRLVSDPPVGIGRLEDLATRWANYEAYAFDEIERAVRLAGEHLTADRIIGRPANVVRLWQARLVLIYDRPALAAEPLRQVEVDPATDPQLAAELAELTGDMLLATDQMAGLAEQWQAAADLYTRAGEPLSAYLVREKMRAAALLPDAPPPDQVIRPPTAQVVQILDNVEQTWIEGVLKRTVDQESLLDVAVDRGSGFVTGTANLLAHTAQAVDRPLPDGRRLTGLFDNAGRSLLILGAPGSGKTVTLLQLLQEQIELNRRSADHPLPLLFNLSSFGRYDGSFFEWLVDQAHDLYRIDRASMRLRLTTADQDSLSLLLDGLDEVPDHDAHGTNPREACVQAINTFQQQSRCGLVVCSRLGDYRLLENQLSVAHAVVLQPLSNHQIRQTLRALRPPEQPQLAGWLIVDWRLREALRSPLLLGLLPEAFPPDGPQPDPLPANPEGWREAIMAGYAAQRLGPAVNERGEKSAHFRWLSFLAGRLQHTGSTMFLLEKMQPDWLPGNLLRPFRWRYGFLIGAIEGFILTGIFVLNAALNGALLSPEEPLWVGAILLLLIAVIFGPGFVASASLASGFSTWLTAPIQKTVRRGAAAGVSNWLTVGILGGVVIGFFIWLINQVPQWRFLEGSGGLLPTSFLGIVAGGVIIGLVLATLIWRGIIISAVLLGAADQIRLRDRLALRRPTLATFARYFWIGLAGGLVITLVEAALYLFFSFILGLVGGITAEGVAIGVLAGTETFRRQWLPLISMGGLGGALLSFFQSPIVDQHARPGQGLIDSRNNGLILTAVAALLLSVLFITTGSDEGFLLVTVTTTLLPFIFTYFGGMAWAQHRALQRLLARHGWLPKKLVPWLDEMASRGILRRVGAGYIFFHRRLLEYFAERG